MTAPRSLLLLALTALPAWGQELPFLEYARIDPHKVMTAESCGECHAAEFEVWKRTPHATGFKALHRKPRAEQIASKLGFRLIKRESFCFTCHYTPEVDDDAIRVVSGVSCESCHGAGLDWIDLHNDYGGAADHHGESDEHRRARIERSRAAGMRRPSDLYPVVANCFSCHTVPNEELVNVGGHSTGSASFEFVEWSQERIRHNFLDSFKSGAAPVNAERPMSRKRQMYVVGRALDLEYSLRGMAEAQKSGIYSKSMARRIRSALAEIQAIARSTDLPTVDEMVATVRSVKAVPNNRQALLQAAERVGAATQRFLGGDGTNLAALDPLVLGTAPAAEPAYSAPVAVAVTDAGSPSAPSEPTATPAVSTPSSTASSPAPPATSKSARATPTVEGAFKTRVHAPSDHGTLGPASCGGCHTEQNEWWFDHPHSLSVDPFFAGETRNLQIARLYGLSPAQMTRGNQICMDCHGTVVSGKETRDVLDGVGCESCHGPANDWLEPHKVEGGGTGANRPGYLEALRLGKTDLKRLDVRARVCTDCHYITEPRLLSAGHPSGADFDYAAGMGSVRHWQEPLAPERTITTAVEAALAARGPVPRVRIATPEPVQATAVASAPSSPVLRRSSSARTTPRRTVPELAQSRVLRARPHVNVAAAGSVAVTTPLLEPFPEIDDTTSIEDVLLLLKERLARLYQGTTGGTADE